MKRCLLVLLGIVVLFSMTFAAEYIGSAKCKMCHKGEKKGNVAEKWDASLHSKAFEGLKKGGNEKKAECLTCHVTGFGKGYKVGDANAAAFEGVGCESCHGPGSEYKAMSVMKDKKAAAAKGLITPTEATCLTCHNKKSPTFKGFNFADAVKKIDHKYLK